MRICFLLKVKQDRLEEYRRRHEQVWPDMLTALRDAGWHNYSLFLGADGLLVGYLETQDFARAQARMQDAEVNRRWQMEMSEFFEGMEGSTPDRGFLQLMEVFHLD